MIKVYFTCFLFLINLLCVHAQTTKGIEDFRTYLDLVYKEIPGDDTLMLDLFTPENSSSKPMPLLTIVHGGGWVAGDRELESLYFMRRLKQSLLENGIAVASISYRLIDSVTHLPIPIQDSKDAIRWLRSHADKYDLDTARIGVWGGSAGGHLALMMANSDNDEFVGDPDLAIFSSHLKFVVDFFGPTELTSLFRVDMGKISKWFFRTFISKLYAIQQQLTYAMTGFTFDEKPKIKAIYNECSPVNYIDNTSPPTLILHGTRDRVVPISQSQMLIDELEMHKVNYKYKEVKAGDHGFNNLTEEKLDNLVNLTVVFIKEQFNLMH